MQIVDAIELYMQETYHENVLTKNRRNLRRRGDGMVACANDLVISKLEKKPTLITNFIQYTPPPFIFNFIDQTNIIKGDVIFDGWQKRRTPEDVEQLLRVHP
jgi:hypothetical protein